jgi:hypothetical protein
MRPSTKGTIGWDLSAIGSHFREMGAADFVRSECRSFVEKALNKAGEGEDKNGQAGPKRMLGRSGM